MPSKPNSLIIYEDSVRAVIATGLRRNSKNPKTGAMVQLWTIRRDMHPMQAIRTGADSAICGDCPLRRQADGTRVCYVRIDTVASIYRAYTAGHYARARFEDLASIFAGLPVRFGAYGEPIALPLAYIEAIASVASSWTGYTHQWRNPAFQAYKRFLMASTSAADYQDAIAAGWRTFTVSRKPLAGLMVCPASHEFEAVRGYKLDCESCGRCAGQTVNSRSVQIQPHGLGAKHAN